MAPLLHVVLSGGIQMLLFGSHTIDIQYKPVDIRAWVEEEEEKKNYTLCMYICMFV